MPWTRNAALWAIVAVALTACGEGGRDARLNVRPPRAGVPATAADVTGIYRSIHQGLLQLRADGQFVLIVPEGPGPTAGDFTLEDGQLAVRTAACGDEVGSYRVEVTGLQEPGKATLTFTEVRDGCADRRRYLTIDPWVYANS